MTAELWRAVEVTGAEEVVVVDPVVAETDELDEPLGAVVEVTLRSATFDAATATEVVSAAEATTSLLWPWTPSTATRPNAEAVASAPASRRDRAAG